MTTHFLLVFPFSAELCGLLTEHFDGYLVPKFYSNTVHIRNPGTTLLTTFLFHSRSMLYLMFMMVLAGTCDRAALFNDYMIAEKVLSKRQ